MTRKELYSQINKLGLQGEVKKQFGDNYTRCSNDQLASVIEKATKKAAPKASPKKGGLEPNWGSLCKLVEILHKKKILLDSEVDAIMKA